ncbi:MAG: RidA family protein [Actinomycetota bacterium]|nr:RidA family protein [Actinomycetota bacterium]
MSMEPTPVDPPQMQQSAAFAQGMIAPAGRTLYIGGQNGVDADGHLREGLGPQTEQALRNVLSVLDAAGTDADHVVKMTIYLAVGIDPMDAFAASARVWGTRRTAVSVLSVNPAREGALVEIEAIAMIPASEL